MFIEYAATSPQASRMRDGDTSESPNLKISHRQPGLTWINLDLPLRPSDSLRVFERAPRRRPFPFHSEISNVKFEITPPARSNLEK